MCLACPDEAVVVLDAIVRSAPWYKAIWHRLCGRVREMRIIPLAAVAFLLIGCAGTQPRHERLHGTLDREVAYGFYGIGGFVGFVGCVVGFASPGAQAIAIPLCIGGWASGMGGIAYLAWDDKARGDSYCKAHPKEYHCSRK